VDISLATDIEQFVSEPLQGGRYRTVGEVIAEGLRLLREREQSEALRNDIATGIEQADAGRLSPFDRDTLQEVQAAGRAHLAAGRRPGVP